MMCHAAALRDGAEEQVKGNYLTQNLLFSTEAPGMLCIRSSSTRHT